MLTRALRMEGKDEAEGRWWFVCGGDQLQILCLSWARGGGPGNAAQIYWKGQENLPSEWGKSLPAAKPEEEINQDHLPGWQQEGQADRGSLECTEPSSPSESSRGSPQRLVILPEDVWGQSQDLVSQSPAPPLEARPKALGKEPEAKETCKKPRLPGLRKKVLLSWQIGHTHASHQNRVPPLSPSTNTEARRKVHTDVQNPRRVISKWITRPI